MWKRICLLLALCFSLTLSSCGREIKPASPIASEQIPALQQKYEKYLAIVSSHQDAYGFIDTDACDSLLFSALVGVSESIVNIEKARDSDGRWHRRPDVYAECYPDSSASSISKDMLLGLMIYIWEQKRLDLARDLFQYGEDHNWVMGEGDPSRTNLSPGLQATLAELIFRMGGENHEAYRSIPAIFSGGQDGYQAHLEVLHINLRAELVNSITERDLTIVKKYYQKNPANGLFTFVYHKYTDGDQSETIAILMDEKLFPSDRAPSARDRGTEWLWQRDLDDWAPKDSDETYSGGDFVFLAAMLLRDL